MELPIYTVDSFTNKPFSGNPAAVCIDTTKQGLSCDLMQRIAAEINLSETAFLQKVFSDDDFSKSDRFMLRWFTPTNEVPLCGHATLATAAVIFNKLGNSNETLNFETLHSGVLQASKGPNGSIRMVLPLNTPSKVNVDELSVLIKTAVGQNTVKDVAYSVKTKKLLIRFDDSFKRENLEKLEVPTSRLVACEQSGLDIMGVILTIKGDSNYHFFSRYFAPWNGIPEDPVTGAAHTVLAGYWGKELGLKTMKARQSSRRGGDVSVTIRDDGRLDVNGEAVIVIEGTITV